MGYCGQATKAKENTIVGQEKEQINLAWSAIDTKYLSGEEMGDVLAEFQEELNHLAGEGKTEVTVKYCYFEIKYKDSGKIYYLDLDYSGRVQITSKEELLAKAAIQIEVDSGEDGIVKLPIPEDEGIVEWGDGTTSEPTVASLENIKLASLENIKIAGVGQVMPEPYRHEYAEKNKKYTVKIYGRVSVISSEFCNTKEKILGISDWGETGLRYICLGNCTNLKNIASPRSNSFKEIENFSYAFNNCTSLTSIPQDLFNNCTNVYSFLRTFNGCTSLTGDAIPLWNRVEHGENNGWVGEPDGRGCYSGCVNLNNYDSIPEYWKRRSRVK